MLPCQHLLDWFDRCHGDGLAADTSGTGVEEILGVLYLCTNGMCKLQTLAFVAVFY